MLELFSTTIVWGLSFALAKKALNDFHPLELVTLRLTFAFFTAHIILRVKNPLVPGELTKFLWPSFLIGLFEFSGTYILYTLSLKYLPSGTVGALTLATPMLTLLISALFRAEVINLKLFFAVLLSIFGAGLCLPFSQLGSGFQFEGDGFKGFVLIMLSNLAFALGNVLVSRYKKSAVWSEKITVLGLGISALIAWLVTLTVRGSFRFPREPSAWLLPIYLGVIATGLGFFLWNRGVSLTTATKASVIGNLKAPLSLLFGFILLGEDLNIRILVGALLLLVSAVLISNRKSLRALL